MKLKVPPNCDLTFGFEIVEKEPGRTLWSWTPDERWENPGGVIQGGTVAAFADTTMAATVVTALEGRKAVVFTAESKISFLRAVTSGVPLTCEGTVIQMGGRVAFAEALVRDDESRAMAKASSTWIITPRE